MVGRGIYMIDETFPIPIQSPILFVEFCCGVAQVLELWASKDWHYLEIHRSSESLLNQA